jgi:hypothetical protein
MTFWFLAFKPSIAESLTDQLIKLEGMYDRGTITKQEFEKLKSNLFKTIEDSIEKEKEEKLSDNEKKEKEEKLSDNEKKEKKELIKKLQSEVNQKENYKYTVRKYQSNSQSEWEKMEFLIDDYRFYTHRPGGMKVKRISDGKTVAILSNKFKIKFKNGGEELFVIKKYEENILKNKESEIELINQVNKLKTQIENNILKKIIPEKKLPGKIVLEYKSQKLLSWERAYIRRYNAHFFQLLALDDQPFHFYVVKDQKTFALNMAKFVEKIDIVVAEVKVKLAKKYNLTPEEIELIIAKRKQNYNKQITSIGNEIGKAIENETSQALNTEVQNQVDQEVGKEIAKEMATVAQDVLGAEVNAAVENELANEVNQWIQDSVAEGISAATAEAAIRAGIEALNQGATIEEAVAVCKAAGGGSAACD